MIQQLRIYEIFENNKAAFHARFRDHAARIMRASTASGSSRCGKPGWVTGPNLLTCWSDPMRRPRPRHGRPSWPTPNGAKSNE
jgi:hypothetical protein